MRAAIVPTLAPVHSIKKRTRTNREVAEAIYMGNEVSVAVLRAEIDMLRTQLTDQAVEIARVHNSQNDARLMLSEKLHAMQLTMVTIVGEDKKSGMVYSHKGQLRKLFDMHNDLKSNVMRIMLYLAGAVGAGTGIGKFFL